MQMDSVLTAWMRACMHVLNIYTEIGQPAHCNFQMQPRIGNCGCGEGIDGLIVSLGHCHLSVSTGSLIHLLFGNPCAHAQMYRRVALTNRKLLLSMFVLRGLRLP